MKAFVIGILVVVIVGGGGYLVLHKDNSKPSAASTAQAKVSPSTQPPVANDGGTNIQVAATITYTDNGFSPAVTTVMSGDTVAVENKSSNVMQFASDPHPQHTDDLDLNVGNIDPGQTATFKVTKKGNYGFHDHFNAGNTGRITIQ